MHTANKATGHGWLKIVLNVLTAVCCLNWQYDMAASSNVNSKHQTLLFTGLKIHSLMWIHSLIPCLSLSEEKKREPSTDYQRTNLNTPITKASIFLNTASRENRIHTLVLAEISVTFHVLGSWMWKKFSFIVLENLMFITSRYQPSYLFKYMQT